MKKYILVMLLAVMAIGLKAQLVIRGQVRAAGTDRPVPSASIQIAGTRVGTFADTAGNFLLHTDLKKMTLLVSSVGYDRQVVNIADGGTFLTIRLVPSGNALQEIVVSTGYQQIPRERATGSFSHVSNATLSRRVSTDILSRLQDAVPGLIFNKVGNGTAGVNSITIRGRSTISGNPEPLIVVDNFPFDQDITNINPNDVENVTVLKDAAAASIWGSRAGNGVIVITTKKGKYNQAAQVSLNTSVTFGARPNQFYLPQMTSADYIGIEEKLFAAGFYKSAETSAGQPPLTPVVELLIAKRDGKIAPAAADAQIEALKGYDVRNDYNKYFNRVSVFQQHALSVSGGSAAQRYFVSAGYDKDLQNLVGNQYDRKSVNATNTYSLFNGKVELTAGLYYTESNTQANNPGTAFLGLSNANLYPYAQLADAAGNPLTIARGYRLSFIQAAQQRGLLNWAYQPLAEIGLANNHTFVTDYRLNTGLKYIVLPGLRAELLYQYGRTFNEYRNMNSTETYYTRDQINNLTVVNADGSLTRPIPLGGILDLTSGDAVNQNLRAQLNFSKDWTGGSNLTAIGGYEMRDGSNTSAGYRLYGYDDEHATSQLVNYTATFPRYVSAKLPKAAILNNDTESELADRFLSYFANASYTYHHRYQLSASGRLDQSNLFGVTTNQKGVPLYSAGIGWNVTDEPFFKLSWLTYLKIRATYGYNGNVDKNLSAYTTASYNSGASSLSRLPYATVQNPPNPELRWEKVNIINIGLDYAIKNNVISGTVEYYSKWGIDLIGTTPFPPSSGISTFTGNFANTAGQGLDFNISSRNIDRDFKWLTSFFFSYATDKVTRYNSASAITGSSLIDNSYLPNTGKPLYSIYSYAWAGLDPQTGGPRGYLNDQVSSNYAAIKAATTKDNIVYNGPARPAEFGAMLNTFTYKNVSLSANVSYRLGYYFRRHSITYGTDQGLTSQNGDYEKRWQKPGDEAHTQVPSVPSAANISRDYFYTWSSVLVEKGDNIRLQDINVSYTLESARIHWLPVRTVQLYAYVNNVCLLWKANKAGLDPDSVNGPPVPRTIAFGLKAGF
jgi:TonB-linked SusC/RagA family outer membrane protein